MEYRPVDRDQLFLLPPSMRDWLPADHLALLVEDVVAEMDTCLLHGTARLGGVGRAPYDPDMLLGLLVYGYAVGVRSSRQIETRCHTDVAFRYLCAQDVPDHAVIARFRRAHADALVDLLTEVLVVAVRLGMGRFGHIAVDGTKIAASASRDANRGVEALRRLAAELVDESIAVDDAEDVEHGDRRGDELPPAARDRSGRRGRIADALAKAEAAAEACRTARATTRAEARVARAEQAVAQARTAQTERIQRWQRQRAADGICPPGAPPAPVETAYQVRDARDRLDNARTRLAKIRQANTDAPEPRANLTDPDSRLLPVRAGGFIQGYNCQTAVSDDHLITAVAIHDNPNDTGAFQPMMTAAATTVATIADRTGINQSIDLITADAGYDSDDNLTADGPDRLIAQTNRHTTARQQPATGQPTNHATPRDRMAHRLRTPDGHTAYKRRAATVEPVNGHLKDRIGLRQLLLRGATGATIELTLAAIAHNIRRIHTHLTTQPT